MVQFPPTSFYIIHLGLTPQKLQKFVIFGINLPQKGYIPLSDLYEIWLGEEVPGSYPHTKFRHYGLKNVEVQPPKSPKLVFFGINLPKWGITP